MEEVEEIVDFDVGLIRTSEDIVDRVRTIRAHGKKEVLGFLSKIAERNHLYMRGEILEDGVEHPVKFPKLMSSGESATRVILSSKKHATAKTQIWFDCNGLVFDADTWEPLVVPPNTLNHAPNIRGVEVHLKNNSYDIIPVLDGSLMTFYYWRPSRSIDGPHNAGPWRGDPPLEDRTTPPGGVLGGWCISTANGYDVSSLKWIGDKTFAEIAFEVLDGYPEFVEESGMKLFRPDPVLPSESVPPVGPNPPTEPCEIRFDRLDKNFTYSVIIRHHDFHPLKSDPMGAWTVKIPPESPFNKLPKQTVIMEKYPNLADLRRKMAKSVKNLIENGEINYGFILRGTRDLGECSHVLLPSKLYTTIKNMVYSKAPKEIRGKITHKTRSEFISLRAYLNHEKLLFAKLFPHLAERFARYETFIDSVANMILRFKSQAKIGAKKIERPTSPVGIIAFGLFGFIQDSNMDINPFQKDAKSVVLSIITQPQHAYLYLKAMTLAGIRDVAEADD